VASSEEYKHGGLLLPKQEMGTFELFPERLKEASFIGFPRLGSPASL
jgi:hypothetical protein